MIARHCRLRREPLGRGRESKPDAYDTHGNPFELKSATKSGVTTARDVGLHTVREWRKRYWIVAVGRNLRSGFHMDALYVAHPSDLASFFDRIEARLAKDWDQCQEVIALASGAGATPEKVERVTVIMQRGITINNPKIPLSLFSSHAKQISHTNSAEAALQIKEFTASKPLLSH